MIATVLIDTSAHSNFLLTREVEHRFEAYNLYYQKLAYYTKTIPNIFSVV